MSDYDAVAGRSMAVLGRFSLCMSFSVREDLREVLETVYPSEYEALREASAGMAGAGKGGGQPLVLFSSPVEMPKSSVYQERMGALELASRVALLKLDLRDLYKLVEAGLLTFQQAEEFRNIDPFSLDGATVYDVISFLNDLVVVRHISETTAKCYRRWMGSHLESISFPDASVVREWVIPYSRSFFTLAFGFIDYKGGGEQSDSVADSEMMVGSFALSGLRQLDLFETPTNMDAPGVAGATAEAFEGMAQLYEAKQDENLKALVEKKTGEYSYISGSILPVFMSELLARDKSGHGPRYKYGEIAAAIFQCSLFTGLRHIEWFDAVLHENGYTDSKITDITLTCPVLQVFSVKQGNRRADNPLRDYRLLVLEGFDADYIGAIRDTLAVVKNMELTQDRKTINKNIRMQLLRVWKKLVKEGRIKETKQQSEGVVNNNVSMHTARKTFAEEVRRSQDYTRFELAAMLGHTTLLNLRYYAKAKRITPRTHDFPLPKPWPGDAASLEEWSDTVTGYLKGEELNAKMQQLAAAGAGGRSAAPDWDDTLSY